MKLYTTDPKLLLQCFSPAGGSSLGQIWECSNTECLHVFYESMVGMPHIGINHFCPVCKRDLLIWGKAPEPEVAASAG